VKVAWPLQDVGWVLDQTPTLIGENIPWSQVPTDQYQTNAAERYITLLLPLGNKFYRLRQP